VELVELLNDASDEGSADAPEALGKLANAFVRYPLHGLHGETFPD
jgi:hypothetical protein